MAIKAPGWTSGGGVQDICYAIRTFISGRPSSDSLASPQSLARSSCEGLPPSRRRSPRPNLVACTNSLQHGVAAGDYTDPPTD